MRIFAKIFSEDEELAESLRNKGIDAKLRNKNIFASLPEITPLTENNLPHYRIPKEIPRDRRLLIEVSEQGGGRKRGSGRAVIVCRRDGRPLRPTKTWARCGTQALFSVATAIITIVVYQKHGNIVIREHWVALKDHVAHIATKTLWSGQYENLITSPFDRYATAAKAAVEKASCIDCQCIHFAAP